MNDALKKDAASSIDSATFNLSKEEISFYW